MCTGQQPFAPFSKSDRLGRACEWNYTRDRERNRNWQRNLGYGREGEPSPFVMEQVIFCVSAYAHCVDTIMTLQDPS